MAESFLLLTEGGVGYNQLWRKIWVHMICTCLVYIECAVCLSFLFLSYLSVSEETKVPIFCGTLFGDDFIVSLLLIEVMCSRLKHEIEIGIWL